MVCYTRNARDLAPGCVGGEELGDGVDVCIFRENNPTPSPTRAPTPYPTFTPGSVPSGTFKLKLYWDNYNWQEVGFLSFVFVQRMSTLLFFSRLTMLRSLLSFAGPRKTLRVSFSSIASPLYAYVFVRDYNADTQSILLQENGVFVTTMIGVTAGTGTIPMIAKTIKCI